jgi:hypothetical protein
MVFFCFIGEVQQAASSLSRANLRFTLWFLLHFGMRSLRFMGWRVFDSMNLRFNGVCKVKKCYAALVMKITQCMLRGKSRQIADPTLRPQASSATPSAGAPPPMVSLDTPPRRGGKNHATLDTYSPQAESRTKHVPLTFFSVS